jgi:hypothetical protein
MVQKFYFKSIGDNLKIAVYLFFKRFVKNGKLKFQITNQQITIQTKCSGLKIEDIP